MLEKIKNNILKACTLVEDAASKGGEFIAPEVFNYRGPFFDTDFVREIAENIPGDSINPLIQIAIKRNVHILAGSIYEKAGKNKMYNTSVVIDNNGKIIATYRKINLFEAIINGNEIKESDIFLEGDTPVILRCKWI